MNACFWRCSISTCTTLIEPSGRRSFITTEGVEAEPQIEDLEHLELVGGDWVYATGYDLVHPSSSAVLSAWLLRLPQDVGLIVDLGPVQAEMGDDLLRAVLARSILLTGNHLEMTGLIERLGSPGALRSAAPRALIIFYFKVDIPNDVVFSLKCRCDVLVIRVISRSPRSISVILTVSCVKALFRALLSALAE